MVSLFVASFLFDLSNFVLENQVLNSDVMIRVIRKLRERVDLVILFPQCVTTLLLVPLSLLLNMTIKLIDLLATPDIVRLILCSEFMHIFRSNSDILNKLDEFVRVIVSQHHYLLVV